VQATDLAIDGAAMYLVVRGTGIVRHAFAPTQRCGVSPRLAVRRR
jgi:hypothetical protein